MAWNVVGRTALVTGATGSIGQEIALALARQGARVVMVGRDQARTDAAAADVAARSGSQVVWPLVCDLASPADVRRFAAAFLARFDRCEILVNNAACLHSSRTLTPDGVEATIAVNHLGGFLLTALLRDRIVQSAPARIVTVASIGHRRGTLDFDDLQFRRGYTFLKAYGRSKLANVLFASELARQLQGTGVTSNSIHPGAVKSRLQAAAPLWAQPFIWLWLWPRFIGAEQAAAHVVKLVVDPALSGVTGRYFEEDRMVRPSPLACDEQLAARLWDVSASMVGLPARPNAL